MTDEPYAAQCAAIGHRAGPALTIAGPGSGKTYTIVKRLENLISSCHIEPSSILTITYTNSAAGEMKERAYTLLGARAYAAGFGTFHSVFFGILKHSFGLNGSNILKKHEKYMILCDIARALDIDTGDMAMLADEISGIISRRKNGIRDTAVDEEEALRILELYNGKLKKLRLLDFDDMIIKCKSLLEKDPKVLKRWQDRYRYIQVDEFQDINPVQYETLKLLAGSEANIFAVGDDDQSIYGFRGASPDIMQRFISDHPGLSRYELNVNYRCCRTVAEAADRVISENTVRIEKHHESFDQTGEKVDIRCFANRSREADEIAKLIDKSCPEDYAVLVRTNELKKIFEEELRLRGIAVSESKDAGSIYDSDTAKDVTSYIRLAAGEYERADILRIINRPVRYISREAFGRREAAIEEACIYYRGCGRVYENALRLKEDIRKMGRMHPENAMRYLMKVVGYEDYLRKEHRSVEELYRLYEISSGYTSLRQWLKDIRDCLKGTAKSAPGSFDRSGVSVMTLHASKGLEFKEVMIADVNEGIIPYHKAVFNEEIEEERRLLYVGMTRASKKLHIFSIEDSFGKKLEVSRFVAVPGDGV